ncbi:MAG: UDP-N-acetylmuramate--L-alanine ligase [Eubacteriales bacterium]|nr:UDP-N-acetylmuramate--L-alanine ligase [Eubacteriales bacterium]
MIILYLNKATNIHFIGIGGISMSGLAQILANRGYKISGSDLTASDVTEKLQSLGITVSIGHSADNITNPDLVVYTAAVKNDNPELVAAKASGIQVIDRASLLGEMMNKFKYSVAVAGTHGKTTTTAMVSMILLEACKDPSIHVGGQMSAIGGSVRAGGEDYFVTEACEYVGSFLTLHPFAAVILNIEYDHADYFRDIQHVKETFHTFLTQVLEGGYVVANADDANVISVLDKLNCRKVTFGLQKGADWTGSDITFDENGYPSFLLYKRGSAVERIEMSTPGIHNVDNALAAIAACAELGCSIGDIKRGIKKFTGMDRRLERKGIVNGVKIFDDYAHHPSEIKASLAALVKSNPSKILCVFQPHTYSRTKALLHQFAEAFTNADKVVMIDIYAAREKDPGNINSKILADEINKVSPGKAVYMDSFENAAQYIRDNAKAGDIAVTMGAGNVNTVGKILMKS